MKKYYRLILVALCCVSVIALLVYRHQYNRLRYVLEVLEFFGKPSDPRRCVESTPVASDERERVDADSPPTFQRIDDDHFAYSSFWRNGASHTLVLGSKRSSHDFGCEFAIEDELDPAPGAFSYTRLESNANAKRSRKYVLFVFHCKPATNSGTPFGVMFYSESDPNPPYAQIVRTVDVDVEQKPTTSETSDGVSFENEFKIAACVVPTSLPFVSETLVFEFLSFHKLIGISEFHVYDNSLPFRVLETLRTLHTDALGYALKVFPFNFPFPSEDAYHATRDLAELDCAFRNLNRNRRFERGDALSKERISHVVNLAWDEFVVPRYHRSLRPLLTEHELGQKVKLQLPTLHFCVNQKNDPKIKSEYPNVIKKTHYDKTMTSERAQYVYNIGSINSNDIVLSSMISQSNQNPNDVQKTEKISQEIVAIHKYIDCTQNGFGRRSKTTTTDFDKLETRPHRFEGAMFRFAEDLYNSQLYRLYRTEVAVV